MIQAEIILTVIAQQLKRKQQKEFNLKKAMKNKVLNICIVFLITAAKIRQTESQLRKYDKKFLAID